MTDSTVVTFNPWEPGFFDDPYRQYGELRAHDPVHHSPLEVWVLFRYDDVVRVLRDPTLSADIVNAAPNMRTQIMQAAAAERLGDRADRGARAMLGLDPPDHTRLRRLVSKAFTPKTVEQLRPRIQELVDDTLDRVAAQGSMDVVADLAFPLPFAVISEMLGMPDGNRDEVRAWSHAMTKTLDPVLLPAEVEAAMDAFDHFEPYLADVITWKRRQPADDLLSALIAAEDEGDVLTEDELTDQVTLLFIAGHETTVNLIGNGTLALLQHRSELDRLQADPSLVTGAVEELLRFDSPVQFSRRITTADLDVEGHTIAAGTFVLTCLGSANRDPDRWGDDADRVDVGRADAGLHVSFGSGIHHCLGASLARTEAQVAIGSLVQRFPGLALAGEPAPNGRIVLRGLDALPVSLG